MPNRCTWIDDVEIEPLDGGNLHFTLISGDERMRFCMPRAVGRRASSKTSRMLDAADKAQQRRMELVRAMELDRTG